MPSISWPSFLAEWGSTAAERAAPYPCDRLLGNPELTMFRAVDVAAPATTAFRWLCQLRAAPYSYDKLDNFGRRSPQALTPGLDELAPGQRFQTIFRLVEFEPGRSLTMVSSGRVVGRVACTYLAEPAGPEASRIVVKISAGYARGIQRPLMKLVLPPGDLLMMRRQLLNLKQLAERSAMEARSA
jgi:hypothetical protein